MTVHLEKSIVVSNGIDEVIQGEISAERMKALETLSTGEVPHQVIREHIGKGGKKFQYLDHVWVTRQLRVAFGQMWEFETSNPVIWEDGSASVMCKLTIKFFDRTGNLVVSSIQEVGAWEDSSGKMPHAMRIASAASRGLVRCAFRKFGIGENLYSSDIPEITAQDCWKSLLALAQKQGMSKDELVSILKAHEISSEDLVDRYIEAYQLVLSNAKGE